MIQSNFKIIIADDHKLIISGIAQIIEMNNLGTIVAEVYNGLEVLQLLKEVSVDLLILDINMPELNGMETAEKLLQIYPTISIMMLSQYENIELIKKFKKMGVKGYLTKSFEISQLIEAIKTIELGNYYFPSLDSISENDKNTNFKLSGREIEIIEHISKGKTTKEIAIVLFLSEHTVETHRKNIMRKLEVNSIIGLLNAAKELGYVF